MQLITISPKGQITIPSSARKLLQNKHLLFEMKGSTIILRPVNIQYDDVDIDTAPTSQDTTISTPFDFWNNPEDDIYEKFYSAKTPRTSLPLLPGALVLVPFMPIKDTDIKLRPAVVLELLKNGTEAVIAGVTSKKNEPEELLTQLRNEDLTAGRLPLISYIPRNKKITIPASLIQKVVGSLQPEIFAPFSA